MSDRLLIPTACADVIVDLVFALANCELPIDNTSSVVATASFPGCRDLDLVSKVSSKNNLNEGYLLKAKGKSTEENSFSNSIVLRFCVRVGFMYYIHCTILKMIIGQDREQSKAKEYSITRSTYQNLPGF